MDRPRPFRILKRWLPRGLFWRSLIIIVAPVVLLQCFVSYAFFVRHYDIMTARMARGVAGDVAFLVNLEESHPPGTERTQLLDMAARNLGYQIALMPNESLSKPYRRRAPYVNRPLNATFRQQLGEARPFSTYVEDSRAVIRVEVRDGVLQVQVPIKRLEVSNADVFVLWMVISSLVLLAVAIMFLRGQVRPIERLAKAAESFGKGRPVNDFKPYGATEVRRAAQAFVTMRERIERYVQQRTEMLAGVSHDMKTPLTRMKLELAMMPEADAKAMKADIAEMEHMLDEYLDFARGETGEDAQPTNLADIVEDAARAAARGAGEDRLHVTIEGGAVLTVRRAALRRCAANLIDNALKYGRHVEVTLKHGARFAEIVVDDDGPGIPEHRREEAFRPFHRLDEGRNLQKGGSGLGLAIARDIARSHGGDLLLSESPKRGLRATIRLPI
ncbi:MAG: HAMP domain-containing protein [Proteobacteria bacterium]|nr:HAMP domain-containing protein [Pseudomonadota bacterium]